MVNLETIYFIHHSHTDIGYTHDQPIVWDLNERFFDDVLDCCEAGMERPDDAKFRWTVESTAMLWRWLQHTSPKQIDRFMALEKQGLIEVTAMLANITPLYDIDQLIESFQVLRTLRNDYGFTIRNAMNCDVNGQSWALVDILLDLGVEGFMMAVNPHYGGSPFQRPNAFWWTGPQGRPLLTWNGWLYISGWRFGIGHDDFTLFEETWLPKIERHLEAMDYPYRQLMIQSAHPFGDNGTAFLGFSDFIERWNNAGKSPRIVFATPQIWWDAFKNASYEIPTHGGDWTDYWNFGCISSSREQTINRMNRTRLHTADALGAIVSVLPDSKASQQAVRSLERYRAEAWHHLNMWDEHTWGADQAIHQPYLDDTMSQWNHKAHNAYKARSFSLLMQRDGLAALAQQVERAEDDMFLLFNPLPYPRTIAGHIGAGVLSERFLDWDISASRHYQDRLADVNALALYHAKHSDNLNINATISEILSFNPVEVPAFGYVTISKSDLYNFEEQVTFSDDEVIENHRHRLKFDTKTGGIKSWYDKQLDCEWVDANSPHVFHGYIHEGVISETQLTARKLHYEEVWHTDEVEYPDGWKTDWQAHHQRPARLLDHQVVHTPTGIYVIQLFQAGTGHSPITMTVFMPTFADYIEFKSSWQMGLNTHPEATYVSFPFQLDSAEARFDLGGQAVRPEHDQLSGACRDYFTVQNWVDFNNGQRGVTIATPDNPMVQLGDFHFGHRQSTFELETALLLGWVTNNYWGTNFRAHQPGEVRSHYRILPYAGQFNESSAHRFGAESAHHNALLQTLGEPMKAEPSLPQHGQLLRLPSDVDTTSSVLTLHIQSKQDGSIIRLLNASDNPTTAQIQSGLLKIKRAWEATLLAEKQGELIVDDGGIALDILPREIKVILVELELSNHLPSNG